MTNKDLKDFYNKSFSDDELNENQSNENEIDKTFMSSEQSAAACTDENGNEWVQQCFTDVYRLSAIERLFNKAVTALAGENFHLDKRKILKHIKRRKEKRLRIKRLKERRSQNSGFMGGIKSACHQIYTQCYFLGIQLIRYFNDFKRKLFKVGIKLKYTVPPVFSKIHKKLSALWSDLSDECVEPIKQFSENTRIYKKRLKAVKEAGGSKKQKLGCFWDYILSFGKPLNDLSDFILPILGAAILASTVVYFGNLNYALEITYGDGIVGYVRKENDYYQAESQMKERLFNEEYVALDDTHPSFRLTMISDNGYTDIDTLTNRMLLNSKRDITPADGIYIDDVFLGAVPDGNEFLLYIDNILNSYRSGAEYEKVEFERKIGVKEGIYPVSSIKTLSEIKTNIEKEEDVSQYYIVKDGDTLASIAKKYDTTPKAIIKLNPAIENRQEILNMDEPPVFENEKILIKDIELSLGIKITRRETYREDVPYGVDYTYNNQLPELYVQTLSSGVPGTQEVVADVTYVDGRRVSENRLSETIIRKPINQRKVKGTMKPDEFMPQTNNDPNASFIWPVKGGRLTCGFYGYAGHTGIDIAAPYGTGIYASRSGTVTYASNVIVWPYGRRVDINHGKGVMTRYAHCSQVLVRPGQYVSQGQLIALMGQTGNAFGVHVHFEIRINGKIMNPSDFVGTYYKGY